ncbi:MAG: hypothetical protein GY861_17285 [bacterium]|nr:hypothetical protein [bacterium]
MNRDVEKALETAGFTYKGSESRLSNGDEITQWLCPDNETIIEVITLEEDNREMDKPEEEDTEDETRTE